MDEIVKLAKKAGIIEGFDTVHPSIERFYNLAIKPWADQLDAERKKFSEYSDIVVGAMQDVRRDEREACAKICDKEIETTEGEWSGCAQYLANNIRARSNT